MNDFQTNFLKEYIQPLRQLRQTLSANFSETNRREAFRQLHSLKGCAQTFGLKNCAALADRLETLLAGPKIIYQPIIQNQLIEGLQLLESELDGESSQNPTVFIEHLDKLKLAPKTQCRLLFTSLPIKFFNQFSGIEKTNFLKAIDRGQHIFVLTTYFPPMDFSRNFQSLRRILSESGEIIAIIPEQKKTADAGIGMQIVLADHLETATVADRTLDFSPTIETFVFEPDFSDKLPALLWQISEHIRNVSAELSKVIDLTILANPAGFHAEWTKPVFETILHLVRNALDHGLGPTGELEILVFAEIDGLFLSVADDGNGIDPAKVSRHAIEKKLLASSERIDPRKTLELIFAPELSTSEKVSRISGRGIGLDAVKTIIETLNGKISVKSRKDKGTRFDIFIPPPAD